MIRRHDAIGPWLRRNEYVAMTTPTVLVATWHGGLFVVTGETRQQVNQGPGLTELNTDPGFTTHRNLSLSGDFDCAKTAKGDNWYDTCNKKIPLLWELPIWIAGGDRFSPFPSTEYPNGLYSTNNSPRRP